MSYRITVTVKPEDLTATGYLRPGVAVGYMQEAALGQMAAETPSYHELQTRGLAFVISRLRVRLLTATPAGTALTVQTGSCRQHGVIFERVHRLFTADGEMVAEGMSVWALIDRHTGLPVRADQVDFAYSTDEPLPLTMWITEAATVWEERESRVVLPEETDENRHLNHVHYLLRTEALLPELTAVDVTVQYRTEAPLGEMLTAYTATVSDGALIEWRHADGRVNSRLLMKGRIV